MKQYEGRYLNLKNRINEHFSKLTGLDTDFFSKMKQADIIQLKTVFADINNVLTLKLTNEAAVWLCKYFEIDEKNKKAILTRIDAVKPNSKGFDIVIEEPYKIIAEVKCTSPVNDGGAFGAAQHDSIMDDVYKLVYGKKNFQRVDGFFKFLCLIDLGNRTDQAIQQLLRKTGGKSEKANRYNSLKEDKVFLLDNFMRPDQLDIDKVYIKKVLI
jgi:hypothetical protein